MKTITKLKLTDNAIERIKLDELEFSFVKDGQIKHRDRIYLPFEVPKKSFLKGLKLCIHKSSKSMIFIIVFWYNKKPHIYSVGKYIPGQFSIKQVEEKLYPIYKAHTNDKGFWVANPNETELKQKLEKERLIKSEEYVQAERKTINEVIIELMKANMPKIKAEGTICAKSIREQSRFLIGYNKRTRFLSYSDNESGNGRITFRPKYTAPPKPAPKDWDELISWYPSGKGQILDPKKNLNRVSAIYDNDLGKTFIDELSTGRISQYLKDKPSYSYKKNCLTAIKTLWNFASYQGYLGENPGLDPTLAVQIKRPTEFSDKALNSRYNDMAFSVNQLHIIFNKLDELSTEYPFASENIKLVFCLGQRQEEVFKLKKKDIKFYNKPIQVQLEDGIENIYGEITFRKGTTKRRNKGKMKYITEPVKGVLDQIRDIYKRPGYEQYKLVPWLFPSPSRIDKQRLNNQESGYIRSNLTRLRSTKGCWNTLREQTGIDGVVRMARKTLVTLGKDAGLTNKQMKYISHHDQERTIDINYDKGMLPEIQKSEGKVARLYKFQKKSA